MKSMHLADFFFQCHFILFIVHNKKKMFFICLYIRTKTSQKVWDCVISSSFHRSQPNVGFINAFNLQMVEPAPRRPRQRRRPRYYSWRKKWLGKELCGETRLLIVILPVSDSSRQGGWRQSVTAIIGMMIRSLTTSVNLSGLTPQFITFAWAVRYESEQI